jgi:hypothetical protein
MLESLALRSLVRDPADELRPTEPKRPLVTRDREQERKLLAVLLTVGGSIGALVLIILIADAFDEGETAYHWARAFIAPVAGLGIVAWRYPDRFLPKRRK